MKIKQFIRIYMIINLYPKLIMNIMENQIRKIVLIYNYR